MKTFMIRIGQLPALQRDALILQIKLNYDLKPLCEFRDQHRQERSSK